MINDFFTYPMRIFFLFSSFFGICGGLIFFTNFDFITLHKVFFLQLLTPCAYLGFLLTALPDWTNFNKNLKPHAIICFIFLMVAFIFAFINLDIVNFIIFFIWFYLFIFSFYMILLNKNSNHFSILFSLFCFVIFSLFYALNNDLIYLNSQIFLNCALIIIISFRVSIALGKESFKKQKENDSVFMPNGVYKNISAFCIFLFIFSNFFIRSDTTLGFILLACSCAIFSKLKELHYIVLLKNHYILFYYILESLMAIGFLGYGLSYLFELPYISTSIHILTISGLLGFIYLIFNIAGLRHSGFLVLEFFFINKIGFIFIILATISRSFLLNYGEFFYIYLPSFLLILAFLLYIFKFYIIFRDNEFSGDPE